MFEIGSSLREARMRRQLELSQIERDTRIRAKYLMALEDDRFELLPVAGDDEERVVDADAEPDHQRQL